MKVRLKSEENISLPHIEEYNRCCWNIDSNEIYTVISIEDDDFRLVDDSGEPHLFLRLCFDVTDNSIDKDWEISFYDKTQSLSFFASKEFNKYFFEGFFDRKPENIKMFLSYATKHNIPLVANLAYAPKFKRDYYKKLLKEIENRS